MRAVGPEAGEAHLRAVSLESATHRKHSAQVA